jgi:hypothetical protein
MAEGDQVLSLRSRFGQEDGRKLGRLVWTLGWYWLAEMHRAIAVRYGQSVRLLYK